MNPIELFIKFRDQLAALNPALPPTLLGLSLWGVQWQVRVRYPTVWVRFFSWIPDDASVRMRRTLQGLPSVLVGAAFTAVATGGDVKLAVAGAGAGAFAPLWHHFLAWAPGQYQGALGAVAQDSGQSPDDAVGSDQTGGASSDSTDERSGEPRP